jgi:hypothetical protein
MKGEEGSRDFLFSNKNHQSHTFNCIKIPLKSFEIPIISGTNK